MNFNKMQRIILEYPFLLEPEELTGDKMVQTTTPGQGGLTPWLVEAPLNSVEVFEAVLKPSQPFTIHKARNFPRRRCADRPTASDYPFITKRINSMNKQRRWRYARYMERQGQLARDTELSFVCLPTEATETIRKAFGVVYDIVKLHWMSIPWCESDGEHTYLRHPLALVLHYQPGSRPSIQLNYWRNLPSYETYLNRALEELGLMGSDFSRSLLKPGTVPIPETFEDYYLGIPGRTAALPYFETVPGENAAGGNRPYTLLLRQRLSRGNTEKKSKG